MPKQAAMRWVDLRVGLLVVASIVTLIVLILAVSGDISLFTTRRTYYTELAGAEGLKAGDEVRLAGVRVGSVKAVDFTEVPPDLNAKSSVRVELVIEGEEAQQNRKSRSQRPPPGGPARSAIRWCCCVVPPGPAPCASPMSRTRSETTREEARSHR